MRVMQIDDFLELTEGSGSDARSYDWARLVKEGQAARKAADGGAWRIGDLAALLERRYASGALKRFAEEIGESLGSVRRFRWVAGEGPHILARLFPDAGITGPDNGYALVVAHAGRDAAWVGESAYHGRWLRWRP